MFDIDMLGLALVDQSTYSLDHNHYKMELALVNYVIETGRELPAVLVYGEKPMRSNCMEKRLRCDQHLEAH